MPRSSMLFSIITITRNNLPGLRRTAESVRAQDCGDYEWLIIDGASSDGTADYLSVLPPTYQWISERDHGLYDAMNKGLARAQGDYVLLLNAGDSFAAPDVLTKIKEALADHAMPPGFIYGDALEEWPGHAPVYKPARSYKHIIRGMFTHHQSMLYARDLIGSLRFDTDYKIAADYKFTAIFLQEAPEILYLNFPLCLFEAGGVSQQRVRQGRLEQFRARRELGLCGGLENVVIYLAQMAVISVRRAAPRLYWRLRQSSGNSANGRARD